MLPENKEIKKEIIVGMDVGSEPSVSSIFFMTFRHGMNPFCFKGFRHKGDLKSARNRAWKHGEIMGYKNIWVMPICVDLDQEEKFRLYTGETKISGPVEEGKAPPVL